MSLWPALQSNAQRRAAAARKARRQRQARDAGEEEAPVLKARKATEAPAVIIAPSMDLLEWTRTFRPFLAPGIRFDLEDHLYLEAIYKDNSREIAVKKASQMGLSEWAVSRAFWTCDRRNGNVFYVMPSDTDVYDFSQMRFNPALEASPHLASLVADAEAGRRKTDRVKMKRVKDRFIVFRGGNIQTDGKARQLKSVPADLAIRDEVDEMSEAVKEIVQKRLGHSPLKEMIGISTPTFTGFGIDHEFDLSDQKYWFIRCPHCNTPQTPTIANLVIEEDDLGRPRKWYGGPGEAWLGCVKCGRELDRLARGEWIAKYPDRPVSGYQLTRLISAQTDPLDIVTALQTTNETKRREIYNQDLGLAYTAAGTQITDQDIDACRRDYAHGPGPAGAKVYAGIDVGKTLHVVIRAAADGDGNRRQLYAGEVLHFRDIKALFMAYHVTNAVIDANPETRKARDLQRELPAGTFWLCYYQGEVKRKDPTVWNYEEGRVNADRTRILDHVYGLFYAQKNTLPANIRSTPSYYDHIKASIRTTNQTKRGPVTVYVNSKPDHYAHAEAYCYIATLKSGGEAVAAEAETHGVADFFGADPSGDLGTPGATGRDLRDIFS